jgi:hypothetical protein
VRDIHSRNLVALESCCLPEMLRSLQPTAP